MHRQANNVYAYAWRQPFQLQPPSQLLCHPTAAGTWQQAAPLDWRPAAQPAVAAPLPFGAPAMASMPTVGQPIFAIVCSCFVRPDNPIDAGYHPQARPFAAFKQIIDALQLSMQNCNK